VNNTVHKCSECGKQFKKDKLYLIDKTYICTGCMYGNEKPFKIYPIGVIINNLKRNPVGFGVVGSDKVSRIEIIASQKPFMYRLEDEKELTIIYYLHKAGHIKSIFHRGLDGKKTGLFATRTPDRLSGIAVQNARLLKIEGTALFVEGLDAINGSPVLDIRIL